MKLSVSTYSFQQAIREGRMTQLDCISKAKELGFEGIEFSELIHDASVTDAEYAEQIREEAKRVGVAITAFLLSADFLKEQTPYLEQEIARVQQMIDLAEIMGTKVVRHDVSRGDGHTTFPEALDIFARACREITAYAEKKGIRTCVENHGFFCQGGERMEALYNAVSHKNFGLLVDMGNFVCTDDCPATACARTAPYAIHAHAKDFYIRAASSPNPGQGFSFQSTSGNYIRGAIVGHGDIDVVHCIRALQRGGYDGYLGLEFEGIEDCMLGITIGLENLKRYLGQ
ncbi:MAG: sugar phosphate isomerase/epimerase [Ruminococcaceae bacterium]|nr:sugar phosphate isomerase/epimerase [Oscillospiraceae bacterium]